jgi:hypothetical protein
LNVAFGPMKALGFSHHTGWAIAVTVAGGAVVDRRRVELIDPNLPRQVFHACEGGVPLPEAIKLIDKVTAAAGRCAGRVLAELGPVDAIGVAADTRPMPDDVSRILASHPLMHMAEGQLYRDAILDAAAALDLPVVCIPAKQLMAEGDAEWLAAQGRALGPPWRKDEKLAALAALATASVS